MKTKTHIKSGKLSGTNHNQTFARPMAKRSLKVKSHLKAGFIIFPPPRPA